MGYHRKRERHMDRKREERGMQCYMNKEDNSLIDVKNVETTGERCRHLSWRTPLNSSLCTFIGMKHISPIFMYIIQMYLRLTTFTKTLPQMSFHLYLFAIFFRSGAPPMTLLTAGALTDPRLPATASDVCTTDARLGGVGRVAPSQTKILATPVAVTALTHLMASSINNELNVGECHVIAFPLPCPN